MVMAGAVAAILLLALSWPWRAPQPARIALGWALGVALALFVGNLALGLELRWPPREDRHRFLLLLLPAVSVAEAIAASDKVPRWAAWLLRGLVAAGAGRILLHGSVYLQGPAASDSGSWNNEQTIQYLGCLAAVLMA